MTDKITREQVLNNLKSELETMDKLNEVEEKEEHEEYRSPLSMDVIKEVKILLSWGGGEDGFKLRFDVDNNLISGVYYMANWGEYEEIALNEEELDKVNDFYYASQVIEN